MGYSAVMFAKPTLMCVALEQHIKPCSHIEHRHILSKEYSALMFFAKPILI
jgi:hypothetical protein